MADDKKKKRDEGFWEDFLHNFGAAAKDVGAGFGLPSGSPAVHEAESAGDVVKQVAETTGHAARNFWDATDAKAPSKKGSGGGGGGGSTTAAPADNAYADIANQEASTIAGIMKQMAPTNVQQADENFMASGNAQAEADLGQSGNGAMARWLNANTAASEAQSAGVQALQGSQNAALQQSEKGLTSAEVALGAAVDKSAQAAPYTDMLSALISQVPYHFASGYNIPSQSHQPAWEQQVEKNVGINPLQSSPGVTIPGATDKTISLPLPTPTGTGDPSTPTG
jgi:hypothetical protein